MQKHMMAKRRKNADRKSPFKRGSPGVYAGRAALASILRRRKSWAEKGKARGTVQVSRPAATRCQLVGGCIGLRKESCCIRIGRGPGDRHTIIQFGLESVDTREMILLLATCLIARITRILTQESLPEISLNLVQTAGDGKPV